MLASIRSRVAKCKASKRARASSSAATCTGKGTDTAGAEGYSYSTCRYNNCYYLRTTISTVTSQSSDFPRNWSLSTPSDVEKIANYMRKQPTILLALSIVHCSLFSYSSRKPKIKHTTTGQPPTLIVFNRKNEWQDKVEWSDQRSEEVQSTDQS